VKFLLKRERDIDWKTHIQMDQASDIQIGTTRSFCPECGAVLDAAIVERCGRVRMQKSCAEHGAFDIEAAPDAAFFRRCRDNAMPPVIASSCGYAGCAHCTSHLDRVKTIMIDVTERCNLICPACFTNTHTRPPRDASIEAIQSRLKQWKTRPSVLLCGGEPTLRDDLPELIRAIASMGFVVKAASNGIRLADTEYVYSLREAGLEWILLQFDGFSDDIYRVTRGKPLVEVKQLAIDNCRDAGIKVCLAFMVVRGLNDGEIGRLLDFYMANDHIMHLGFTVLASQGRNDFSDRYATSGIDALRAIERGSGGRIGVEDFMSTRRIGNLLYRLTGNLEYQQKSCFHMALLHRRRDGYRPVNRYLTPGGAVGNPRAVAELAALYGSLRNWDAISLTGRVKLLTVEDFRPQDTIDLVDADRCNKVYMTDTGYIPPCIYNARYRATCPPPGAQ
jgi:uncharacterized radical SAM superfamily Fe-S cluster-containing enzyme